MSCGWSETFNYDTHVYTTMDENELKQNADFLSIALEEMDSDSVAYEFVEDVYENMLEDLQ